MKLHILLLTVLSSMSSLSAASSADHPNNLLQDQQRLKRRGGGSGGGSASVKIHTDQPLGTWDGWGTSFAWWAVGLGDSVIASNLADLFFTMQDSVSFVNSSVTITLPALGLNIVRYNVGGCGRPNDIPGLNETTANLGVYVPYWKKVEGFLKDSNNKTDPISASYDWTRDASQRNMLQLALQRGVDKVQLFSNAPMWWMTSQKSSFGGDLQSGNQADFAVYGAVVAKQAYSQWGLGSKLHSVTLTNEPSAGWWTFNSTGQEGCNIGASVQKTLMNNLRTELNSRSLNAVKVSTSDENSPPAESLSIWQGVVGDHLQVHGYNGQNPFRDNNARKTLQSQVASSKKSFWMSESGDGDATGLQMAISITQDINYMKPSAWIYWQIVEANNWATTGWGPINAFFGWFPTDSWRGANTLVNTKYYVLAQFTRYIRPGYTMLWASADNYVVAFESKSQTLAIVMVNQATTAQQVVLDLSMFSTVAATTAEVVSTSFDGTVLFQKSTVAVNSKARSITFTPNPNSVYTIKVGGVKY